MSGKKLLTLQAKKLLMLPDKRLLKFCSIRGQNLNTALKQLYFDDCQLALHFYHLQARLKLIE
ncbi:hypothetical protein HMPREF9373_0944 [Psychrobacter sp. 1501(2011)]|nr:hypothetical protein HMPREF9373_0944 [Psychrobacter sp. 1501(2011)]